VGALNSTGILCRVHVGQAQKWINMAIKYGFAFGEGAVPGLSTCWHYAHIPIDNYIKAAVKKYDLALRASLDKALAGESWSRMSNYDAYLDFQRGVRLAAGASAPLKLELDWWNQENAILRAGWRAA
jgi:hypothetical protein